MSRKVLLNFDSSALGRKIERIEKTISHFDFCMKLSNDITYGELATIELTKLNQWIKKRTTFDNFHEASKLINKGDEYLNFVEEFKKINQDDLNYITLENGDPIFDESKRIELKETFKQYLTPERAELYHKINDAIEELNKACKGNKSLIKLIEYKNYNGKQNLNLHKFDQGCKQGYIKV